MSVSFQLLFVCHGKRETKRINKYVFIKWLPNDIVVCIFLFLIQISTSFFVWFLFLLGNLYLKQTELHLLFEKKKRKKINNKRHKIYEFILNEKLIPMWMAITMKFHLFRTKIFNINSSNEKEKKKHFRFFVGCSEGRVWFLVRFII